jgi:hypothetical protein
MAILEEAVTLTGIHSRTIYDRGESEPGHFIETAEAQLLICPDSLCAAQPESN